MARIIRHRAAQNDLREGLLKVRLPRRIIYLAAVLAFLSLLWWVGSDFLSGSEYISADGSVKAEDFLIFYTAGKLANEGRAVEAYNYTLFLTAVRAQIGEPPPDPATTPVFDTEWPIYLYSPPVTLVFRLLAGLSFWSALAVWWLASLLAILGALWLLRRSLPCLQRYPYWVLAMFALGFCPVNIIFGNGQHGAFALLVYTLAFYLTQPRFHLRYDWLAGAAGAVLAFEKPQLLVGLLLVWVLGRRWRVLAGLAMSMAFACAVTLLLLPPATFAAWLGNLLAFSNAAPLARIPDADVTVLALLRWALPFGGETSSLLYYVYLAAALVALVVALGRLTAARLNERRRHWWVYLLAALFSVVTPNYLRIYDLILLILPVVLIFALYDEAGRAMRLRLILVAASLYVGIRICHEVSVQTHVQLAGLLTLAFAGYAGFLLYRDLSSRTGRFLIRA